MKYRPKGFIKNIIKIKYQLFIIWLSFKWIFKVNLGDEIIYKDKKYLVANGTRFESWRVNGLDNGDDGWIKRNECKKVISFKNLIGSFESGHRFYTTSWLMIWTEKGIEPWVKALNIW